MSPYELYRYIDYLQDSGQATERYELAFWQKLVLPLSAAVMMLLAVPFSLGSPRSLSIGRQVVLAVAVGVTFHLASQALASLALILELNAAAVTFSPPLLLLFLSLWLLMHSRR
jgi:lipopolysaccharide export system permease protein